MFGSYFGRQILDQLKILTPKRVGGEKAAQVFYFTIQVIVDNKILMETTFGTANEIEVRVIKNILPYLLFDLNKNRENVQFALMQVEDYQVLPSRVMQGDHTLEKENGYSKQEVSMLVSPCDGQVQGRVR